MSEKSEHTGNRLGFFDLRDMYQESDPNRRSPLLFLFVGMIWILRRLSLFELVKRIVLRDKAMPAAFLDLYLLTIWSLTALIFCGMEPCIPHWIIKPLPEFIVLFCFWMILQIVQTNIYHELWRPIRLQNSGLSLDVSYSRFRNLTIGICNYLYVTCLYGFIYWRLKDQFMVTVMNNESVERKAFDSLFDAVYFSFSIAWSCGSLGIAPRDVEPWGQATIIAQIATTLVLLSILLSTAVSSLKTTGEKPRM